MKNFAKMVWWKKLLWIMGGIIALAIGVIIFLFSYRGSTKEIERVADGFEAPASWKLESEQVIPPMFVCLEGTCPKIQRTWNIVPSQDAERQYRDFISSNKEVTKLTRIDCNEISGSLSCQSNGEIGSYIFQSYFDRDSPGSRNINVLVSIQRGDL